VLAVYDVGSHEGMPYIVSELLEGATLRDRLQQKTVPRSIDAAAGIASVDGGGDRG
jgi:hypothetical protein